MRGISLSCSCLLSEKSVKSGLLFQNQFLQVKRNDIFAVFVGTHVSARDFSDDNNLISDLAELEFDVVEVDVLFCELFFDNDNSGDFLGKLF